VEHVVTLPQAVARKHRHQQQQVLQPLVQAQRAQVRREPRADRGDHPLHLGYPARRLDQRVVRRHDGGGARYGPDIEVCACVARVVEPALAELRHEPGGLAAAREVDPVARSDHLGKQLQVRSQPVGQALVRGGGEYHLAPLVLGGAHERDHIVVQRDRRPLEAHRLGDPLLQIGTSAQPPQRQQQKLPRCALHQQEDRLVQQIGADQRAVAVDAKGNRGVAHG
jgi:hypothetical protein